MDKIRTLWDWLVDDIESNGWAVREPRALPSNFIGLCEFHRHIISVARTFNGIQIKDSHRLAILAHEYKHLLQDRDGLYGVVRKCKYSHPLFIALAVKMELDADKFAVKLLADNGISDHGLELNVRSTDCAAYRPWKMYHDRMKRLQSITKECFKNYK